MELYRLIGTIDSAISVASFRKKLSIYCVPSFCEKLEIVVEEMFHPLIRRPVYNSAAIEKGCVITGPNVSWKSTFIKAPAINTLLTQTIYTCAAKEVTMPSCTVVTSNGCLG